MDSAYMDTAMMERQPEFTIYKALRKNQLSIFSPYQAGSLAAHPSTAANIPNVFLRGASTSRVAIHTNYFHVEINCITNYFHMETKRRKLMPRCRCRLAVHLNGLDGIGRVNHFPGFLRGNRRAG